MRSFEGYKHGINLGGWFSQCDNTEKRYDNFIKKEDLGRIARWGLDHVRVPVDYELVLNRDLTFREEGIKRIADCIDWCHEYGLNMILDLHKTVGYSFDTGENENGLFEKEEYQDIFFRLWREFAKRFGKREGLAFELLNEVSDKKYCDIWNKIIRRAIETIRQEAPTIKILVGGYHHNSVAAIKDLDIPYDENIVYNFHCDSPLIFTHQGAYWIPDMKRDFRMAFDADIEEYRKNALENIGAGHPDDLEGMSGKIGEDYFEKLFAEAIRIAEERNVALYCGEYGVIDRANAKDTLAWYRCICKVFDRHDIGRAAWSYKEMDFGLVDAHYDSIREELIRIL